MTPIVRLIVSAIRGWTHCYTWRLNSELREARRREIESDVWESLQDAEGGHAAGRPLAMLARLLLGIPDDVRWRWEAIDDRPALVRRASVAVGAAVFVVAAVVLAILTPDPPPVPEAPLGSSRVIVYPRFPPPPPPPPPCAPPGFGGPRECTK